ncbi:hypothetical protein EXU85_16450 [Spirosoma sp. KCTC 42546]|nr:hypothetical protein EXU85_16450 [Spirosoma sp. KCTC 42546]
MDIQLPNNYALSGLDRVWDCFISDGRCPSLTDYAPLGLFTHQALKGHNTIGMGNTHSIR